MKFNWLNVARLNDFLCAARTFIFRTERMNESSERTHTCVCTRTRAQTKAHRNVKAKNTGKCGKCGKFSTSGTCKTTKTIDVNIKFLRAQRSIQVLQKSFSEYVRCFDKLLDFRNNFVATACKLRLPNMCQSNNSFRMFYMCMKSEEVCKRVSALILPFEYHSCSTTFLFFW